jgi:hypothetical protein
MPAKSLFASAYPTFNAKRVHAWTRVSVRRRKKYQYMSATEKRIRYTIARTSRLSKKGSDPLDSNNGLENSTMRKLPLLCAAFLLVGCDLGSYDDDEGDDLPIYRGRAVKQWILDLKSDDDYTRRLAKKNLDDMGPEDKAMVPALVAAVDDPDKDVRIAALRLLGQIGPGAKKALPAVDKAKLDKEPLVLQAALHAELRIMNERP